jgi:hypothetical protein
MCISQLLLEDNEYTLSLLDSSALFAIADQDDAPLGGADIVCLTPRVEASSSNTEIDVLWAA